MLSRSKPPPPLLAYVWIGLRFSIIIVVGDRIYQLSVFTLYLRAAVHKNMKPSHELFSSTEKLEHTTHYHNRIYRVKQTMVYKATWIYTVWRISVGAIFAYI